VNDQPVSDQPMSDQPVLRVIRGNATDEEIAAILAVLGASKPRTAPRDSAVHVTSVWGPQGTSWGRRVSRGLLHDGGVPGWRMTYWPR
jgi:Acyl-CoA carboxylase epsilon subunit